MPPTEIAHRSEPRNGKIVFAVLAVALILLSFYGGLDRFAQQYLAETTKESVAFYAMSRLINAGISVLKNSSAEIGFSFGISGQASVAFGQALDPIDDAIERFSSGLVWAIGSLFVQRILLEMASHTIFKYYILVSGALAILAFVHDGWKQHLTPILQSCGVSPQVIDECRNMLVKIFAVSLLLRFIVPVFVSLSFLTVQLFVQPEIDRNKSHLSNVEKQISENQTAIPSPQELSYTQKGKISELEKLKNSISMNEGQLNSVKEKIEELNRESGIKRHLPQMLGGKPESDQLISLRETRASLREKNKTLDDRVVAIQDELECIEKQISGNNCDSFMKKIMATAKKKISNITDKLDQWITCLCLRFIQR